MSPPSGGDPEHLLSSALRAQASGTSQAASDPAASGTGTFGAGPSETGTAEQPAARSAGLPVLRVLLFALVLGLLAGVLAGALTLL